MTAAGRILAGNAGILGWTSSDTVSCGVIARPVCVSRIVLSLNLTSISSSAFTAGTRGATPPPAG
jgi:hypothetical protein